MNEPALASMQELVDVVQRIIDLAEEAREEGRHLGIAEESILDGEEIENAFCEVDPTLYQRMTPTAEHPDTLTRQQVAGLNDVQRDTLIRISLQTAGPRDKICANKNVVVSSANSLVTRGLVRKDWSARTGNGYRLTVRGHRAAEMLALQTAVLGTPHPFEPAEVTEAREQASVEDEFKRIVLGLTEKQQTALWTVVEKSPLHRNDMCPKRYVHHRVATVLQDIGLIQRRSIPFEGYKLTDKGKQALEILREQSGSQV